MREGAKVINLFSQKGVVYLQLCLHGVLTKVPTTRLVKLVFNQT